MHVLILMLQEHVRALLHTDHGVLNVYLLERRSNDIFKLAHRLTRATLTPLDRARLRALRTYLATTVSDPRFLTTLSELVPTPFDLPRAVHASVAALIELLECAEGRT